MMVRPKALSILNPALTSQQRFIAPVALILACVGITVLTYFIIPGPQDTWDVAVKIATGEFKVGGIVLDVNAVLGLLMTIETALFTHCSLSFINHLLQVWLATEGTTPATVDVAKSARLSKLFWQLQTAPSSKVWITGVVIIFIKVLSGAVHTVSQTFTKNGQVPINGGATVGIANSSIFLPSVVSDMSDGSAVGRVLVPKINTKKAISQALLDVARQCTLDGVCGSKQVNSTATIGKMLEWRNKTGSYKNTNSSVFNNRKANRKVSWDVRSDVPTYWDYGNGNENRFSHVPKFTWNVVETSFTGSVYVNCTVFAAWSKREESSVEGTKEKRIIHVYNTTVPRADGFSNIKNYTSEDQNSFVTVDNDDYYYARLATPFVPLNLVGRLLAEALGYTGSAEANTGAFFTTYGMQYMSFASLTDPYGNSTILRLYENEMRFTVERMYKQLLSLALNENAGIRNVSCTNCTVQPTRWVEAKWAFMAVIFGINGICIVFQLVSIGLSLRYKLVPNEMVNTIDLLHLDYDKTESKEKGAEFNMIVKSE
ncbi:hypothetical protein HDU79_001764 [Rhizoclosmatium sp. JEL0117]|nr:hypothetical protein HDU79_001764 [Rhizoclosmatium sp. JEL0117]